MCMSSSYVFFYVFFMCALLILKEAALLVSLPSEFQNQGLFDFGNFGKPTTGGYKQIKEPSNIVVFFTFPQVRMK